MISLRGLLTTAGLAGITALGLRSAKLGAQMQRSLLPAAGEAVAGFLLLPDDAPTPREVAPAWRPLPDLRSPDEEPRASQAKSKTGLSAVDVAEKSGLPLYSRVWPE